MDSARQDMFGCYGNKEILTQNIDLKRLESARKYLGEGNLMVDAIMGTNPIKWNYNNL